MKLSDKDKKMIEWLERQDASWSYLRWIIVISALISLGLFFTQYSEDLVLLILGIAGLSYTLGSWSGRAEVSLLLKVVNELSLKK
ncbi:hypothetical protein C2869_06925 [Saccharobesus litoralis]|uniref:Uncharacterized protein n=1 Tax=Saccharobesus litoralis TaxID=2172099 RepID=A0A2S0VPQ0_9ALTE|nr:hypothetical protein [Saccharobesus litoralis]AWB66184.1 hypothetical protein C2869_06925 [Saccharobesus litoralis]